MSAECKSCGARIWWTVSSTGRAMPVDYEPDPKGLLVLAREVGPDGRDRLLVHGIKAAEKAMGAPLPANGLRYTSHFATCNFAAQHRSAAPRSSARVPKVERRRS